MSSKRKSRRPRKHERDQGREWEPRVRPIDWLFDVPSFRRDDARQEASTTNDPQEGTE